MENFRSLFIATGVFAASMVTAGHLRHPNDSAIAYLVSSAQASPSRVAESKPVAKTAGHAKVAAVAPLFATLPLSEMTVKFEASRPQVETKPQVRRNPVRASASHRAASQGPSKPAARVVAENSATMTLPMGTLRSDLLRDLIRSVVGGRAS